MTINTDKLGWLVAAALAGAMSVGALSGFQGNTAPKFASVRATRSSRGSTAPKASRAALASRGAETKSIATTMPGT